MSETYFSSLRSRCMRAKGRSGMRRAMELGTGCCDLLDPEEDHVERRLWAEVVGLVKERHHYDPREVSARFR